jgi:hypothetical protein
VPKPSIFTEKEIRFLRALVKFKVPFMIVGLAAATLQGAPVVTQDIDLWFDDLSDPKIKKALRSCKADYIPPILNNPPMFAGDDLDLFDIVSHMHGLGEFSKEKKKAVTIQLTNFEVKVLSLEQIIQSKEAANRQKDKLVLPILRDVLRVIEDIKGAENESK